MCRARLSQGADTAWEEAAGYYDRFLPRTSGLTVALARERLLAETLPLEEHDAPVMCLITEEKTRRPR